MHGKAQMSKLVRALGLMSGTSLDGIDVALIETDGEVVKRGPSATYPYTAEFRALLRQAIADARELNDRAARPGCLGKAERELTERHAEAIAAFLREKQQPSPAVEVVGFHGQTVLHRSTVFANVRPRTLTVQLGDGAHLARLSRIDVVFDLRAADCEAGGQGAPLAPVYHRALTAKLPQRPVAVLNLGGVANVTWIGRDGQLIAFDSGPGNALIDDWMLRHAGEPADKDGAAARRGRVDDGVLRELLAHAYFRRVPPKSLDRDSFKWDVDRFASKLDLENGAATLTAFTAGAVGRACEHFPEEPQLWIVTGGGRKNKTLMSMIAGRVHNAVVPAEAVGLDGDALEAEAWAYLAVRSLKGLPVTFPGTTGVPAPTTGGVLARAR